AVVELGRDNLNLLEQVGFLRRADHEAQRIAVNIDVIVTEDALGFDELGNGKAHRGRARAEGIGDAEVGGVERLGSERRCVLPGLCRSEGIGDNAVIPATADSLGGVVGILRLGIDNRFQFIEAVDELGKFAVLREYPTPGEIRVGALDGSEASCRSFELDRADLVDRRCHLADMEALAKLAAKFRPHLLELQLKNSRELGRVKLIETISSHGMTPQSK